MPYLACDDRQLPLAFGDVAETGTIHRPLQHLCVMKGTCTELYGDKVSLPTDKYKYISNFTCCTSAQVFMYLRLVSWLTLTGTSTYLREWMDGASARELTNAQASLALRHACWHTCAHASVRLQDRTARMDR